MDKKIEKETDHNWGPLANKSLGYKEVRKLNLQVSGMSCASCALRIEKVLSETKGVNEAMVNFATGQAFVAFDPAQISPAELTKKIDELGYKSVVERAEFPVGGMSCASCVYRIESALQSLPGVLKASANLATSTVTVDFLPTEVSTTRLKEAIIGVGYTVGRQDSLTEK
ncbi:MAG: copper ion binding protein [Candidatus Saccharicenans sp.]